MEAEEYLAMEAVDVDGRCRGFKEALTAFDLRENQTDERKGRSEKRRS